MKKLIKGDRDGLQVKYAPTPEKITISGWYDRIVGIEPIEMTLFEFFTALGITFKDCRRVFKREARKSDQRPT